ncbi:MAG: 5-(carboxyamino)imidazole ribonucleotide mutase [Sphingobacteriales bacterium]|nr:MAG: 5-(carboxyamino)imidazole ribonucleotide mutase [Sphingobacteriales bacterium]
MNKLKVGVIMGSKSDAEVMQKAADVLKQFDIGYEFCVVSAHRSPTRMFEYAQTAEERGIEVIIAGAGGSAHLPGMVAALTTVPVIGIPVKSSNSLDGWDSLLSIVQMPNDIPVATVAVNGAHNAGLLAVQILSVGDKELRKKLAALKEANYKKVLQQNDDVTHNG